MGRVTRELSRVMEIFYSLIKVRAYAFVKTHQTVHLRSVHFTVNNTCYKNECMHLYYFISKETKL